MNTYEVTLYLMVDASADAGLDNPRLKKVKVKVCAENEWDAYKKADADSDANVHLLSVFNYEVKKIN